MSGGADRDGGNRGAADADADYDAVVVGGGPAGCSAAVFLAREGLDVAVFDRGRSSIARCAHLGNFLGFPAGIDVETFYDLVHDHVERAGGALVDDLVESVEKLDDGREKARFRAAPQEGEPVTARRVVAATRYDGEYLRGLGDDDAMFEAHEHGGEVREHVDREYADPDGTTPVDGLYVASPSEADRQAITAAGRGARVARRVITDARVADGWWPAAVEGVDWVRREAERAEEWSDRERWVEWFDERHGDGPVEPGSDRFARIREAAVDEALSAYVDADEAEARAAEGRRALAGHLDPAAVVDAHGAEALLDEMDDEAIAAHAEGER